MLIISVLVFLRNNLRKTYHAHIKYLSITCRFYRENLCWLSCHPLPGSFFL